MLPRRKFTLPEKGAFTIQTAPEFIKLHTLCIASGRRGSGKSVAVANLVKRAYDQGYFDRILLLTPTYMSNKNIWDIAGINSRQPHDYDYENWRLQVSRSPNSPPLLDVYEPVSGTLAKIKQRVEQEAEEWKKYLEAKELYKLYLRDMAKYKGRIEEEEDVIPMQRLLKYAHFGFFENGPPTWKYRNEVPPRLALIIDDCLGTDVVSRPSEGLVNFFIKHRHIGDGLGISLFLLTQAYSSQNGVPRTVRENCTLLMLFDQSDEAQRKKEYKELGLKRVTEAQFGNMLDFCTAEDFGFLTIDFAAKFESFRFQKNFDAYLNPADFDNTRLGYVPQQPQSRTRPAPKSIPPRTPSQPQQKKQRRHQ